MSSVDSAEDLQATPLFCLQVMSLLLDQRKGKLLKAAKGLAIADFRGVSPPKSLPLASPPAGETESPQARGSDWNWVDSKEVRRKSPIGDPKPALVEWDMGA